MTAKAITRSQAKAFLNMLLLLDIEVTEPSRNLAELFFPKVRIH